jgi:Flp pilus assembly protein TadG
MLRLKQALRAGARFRADPRGFAAVEFALILPVLLLLALGVTEIARFAMLGLKVQHAADTVADLASGSATLTPAGMTDMFNAVRHIVQPFDAASRGRVIVSGVSMTGNGRPTVLWQCRSAGSFSATSEVGAGGGRATLPARLVLRDGETVIVGEMFFGYQATLLRLVPAATIRRVAFYRPRFAMPTSLTGC